MDGLFSARDSELFHDSLFGIIEDLIAYNTRMTFQIRKIHTDYDFTWFFKNTDMQIPELLPEVLASADPPPFEFFLDLPCATDLPGKVLRKHLIVYALTLEKDGEKPRLGIGSAASSVAGASTRVAQYRDEVVWMMSIRTRESLKDGFEITNVGVLMAIPRPAPELMPRFRSWVLSVEAGFTWSFWSVWQAAGKTISDHYMARASLWKDTDWKGLNTHSPVAEFVKGIELSTEEMIALVEKRREKDRQCKRNYEKSPRGRALKKEYRSQPKYKAWLSAYRRARKHHRRALPSYQRTLASNNARAQASRDVLKAVEADEIELDEEVAKKIQPALRQRERQKVYNDKTKQTTAQKMKDSRAALRKVKQGKLNANDPKVKELIRPAQLANKNSLKWLHKAKTEGTYVPPKRASRAKK